jgi:2-phosphosulfolactate phosphatase
MKLDVYFTPLGLTAGDLAGRGVVVIDVLRATTTIVCALANGARAVVPAASSEDAVKMTANLERDGFLLAGERKNLAIPGFSLGNSPREMTADMVGGKTVYLTTTNGTPALVAAQGADPVLVGAAVNFSAVADRARDVLRDRGDLVIICAGREMQFALEDAYAAGRLVKAVKKGLRKLVLNDSAHVALGLTQRYKHWLDAFAVCEAGRQLEELALAEDVTFCAEADRFAIVPTYSERHIT